MALHGRPHHEAGDRRQATTLKGVVAVCRRRVPATGCDIVADCRCLSPPCLSAISGQSRPAFGFICAVSVYYRNADAPKTAHDPIGASLGLQDAPDMGAANKLTQTGTNRDDRKITVGEGIFPLHIRACEPMLFDMKRVPTTLTLPPDLLARLDAAASEDHRSRSAMASRILAAALPMTESAPLPDPAHLHPHD